MASININKDRADKAIDIVAKGGVIGDVNWYLGREGGSAQFKIDDRMVTAKVSVDGEGRQRVEIKSDDANDMLAIQNALAEVDLPEKEVRRRRI